MDDIAALARKIVQRGMPSEAIEPTMGMLVAYWWARCEVAENRYALEDACANLWMGLHGMQKVAVATRPATHFGIVVGNEMRRAARYIKEKLDVDPFREWKW